MLLPMPDPADKCTLNTCSGRRRFLAFAALLYLLACAAPASAQSIFDREPIPDADFENVVPGSVEGTASRAAKPAGGDITLGTSPMPSHLAEMQSGAIRPYGWTLFNKAGVAATEAINPDYRIIPGDKIVVQMWGLAEPFERELTVDLQGNVFLPNVGPVRLEGVANKDLNQRLQAAVSSSYTREVRVYANLLTTRPIGVYVTGAVANPGRFSGERSDGLLYYLQAAGGIDLKRGSFRDVTILRGGREVGRADLYDFLMRGELPLIDLRADDTIVVGPRRWEVAVDGAVRNVYQFELQSAAVPGSRIIELAQPLPATTHVMIRGMRDGVPFNDYVEVGRFAAMPVHNGDRISFQSDLVDNMIMVSVTGQVAGASSFAVPRGTMLSQLLDMVPVDADTADLAAIYLRRKSVAERQNRALEMALDRLQRSVLTATSSTATEAAIRVNEAKLVERFIAKARSVESEGRVVLTENGALNDVRLEAEDVVVIPMKSDVVVVSGEVRMPQTLVYQSDKPIEAYLTEAGGFSERADPEALMVIHQNSAVEVGAEPTVRPGDQVLVLPRTDSKDFAVFKDIVDVLFRIAVSTGQIVNIF